MLGIADIERWNPDDVREVFHAARSRYEAAREAADGLASLPAFETWGGDAAEAARQAMGKTRADLDAHGREALAVALAADQAADGIEDVKNRLGRLKDQAARLHMVIDEATNTVRPGPGFRGDARAAQSAIGVLQPQAGTGPDGIWRDGVYSHADYPRMFTDTTGHEIPRMSGYNMAAVAAGLPDNEVHQSLLPPMLGGIPGAPAPGGR